MTLFIHKIKQYKSEKLLLVNFSNGVLCYKQIIKRIYTLPTVYYTAT